MIAMSQERTRNLLAIHGWSGVLLGLLLYVVILTGAVAVFADEIGDWASPLAQNQTAPLPPGLDAKLRELATTVDAKYHEDIFLFPQAGSRIRTFFHHHTTRDGKPAEMGVEFDLHPQTLEVLDRREGFAEDIEAANTANALTEFLVHLHVSLHIPDPWGVFATGILGLAMMVAAVTGLVLHRHMLRELFTIRRLRDALLARRDTHVIAATWNLPFAFVLAFTGSFFSFAGAIGIPVMAMVAFGGDQEAMIETVVGTPPPEDTTPTPLARLDRILADARERGQSEVRFVGIERFGRADARVTTFAFPPEGQVINVNLLYDGASGEFLQQKPGLGLVPSTGGLLADLMGPLHFGNFGGLASKAVWFALGFASCYVTLTGMLLWTTRRAQSRVWQGMARAVTWVGYGLPLALAATPWAYFIARASGAMPLISPIAWTFIATAAAAGLMTLAVADTDRLRRILIGAAGAAMLFLPGLRLLCDQPGWISAIDLGMAVVPAFDIALLAAGTLCLRAAARSGTQRQLAEPEAQAQASS